MCGPHIGIGTYLPTSCCYGHDANDMSSRKLFPEDMSSAKAKKCPRAMPRFLTAVGFNSNSLTSLSLAGCRAITSLELTCPYLEQVSLDGCDHLENATFCPVGLQSLNLGICPKLNTLNIDAPSMVLLELKGCGVLSQAVINCPLLNSLDASFCSQLKDDFLSVTTASCPLIESLILMSCPSIGSDGLISLRWLPHLTSLDLSYTFLLDLQPVFD
ncbi:F-box family protein, partial [Tanacetum coccineum]